MKENLQGKVCLITGATNGIGEEAAKQIALMGAEIVFIARSPSKAEELKQSLKSLTGRESTSIIFLHKGRLKELHLNFCQ